VYLVLGPAAEDTVRLFGTMELYTYRAYQRVLSESPDLSEVFRQGRTVVYQCRF
jgi:hypothetical protein